MPDTGRSSEVAPAAVLVPIKAFTRAKLRLAPALDAGARALLAEQMAGRVLAAAAPLPVTVVCDDGAVADWAVARGAAVVWTPGLGLNGAVQAGADALAAAGHLRVVVAHADLPLAEGFGRVTGGDGVVVVPDRHDDGTNVLTVPAGAGFTFAYGPGSFRRHLAEADRLGLGVEVRRIPELMWDVDLPADLLLPAPDPSVPQETSPCR
jgi:2-phospho-L-lactate/phosphoenolpyruvate guanylyltransferase